MAGKVSVGVQLNTPTQFLERRVTLVFCPSYGAINLARERDLEALARLFLSAEYDATLAVAARISVLERRRVAVFLVRIGAEKRSRSWGTWAEEELKALLPAYEKYALDVRLLLLPSKVVE
jgi:hypothetical protein